MAPAPAPPPSRKTRTVALSLDVHHQLQVLALEQTITQQRRVTIQELVEQALHTYLATRLPALPPTPDPAPADERSPEWSPTALADG